MNASYATLLREHGLRVTPQRLTILTAIGSSGDHFSIEDLHASLADELPGINLSTVYRTLETFEGHHLVRRVDLGLGRIVYHWTALRGHHHLVCHDCGTITEFEEAVFQPLLETLEAKYGFRADLKHQSIFGHCRHCWHEHTAEE